MDNINSVSDWYKVRAYREALFGETYVKDPHYENGKLIKGRFVQTKKPSVVCLSSLVGTKDYYNYFHELGVPRLAQVLSEDVVIKNGYLMTKDGKYVLTGNSDYNNKVLNQFYSGVPSFRHKYFNNNTYYYTQKPRKRFQKPRKRFRYDVARNLVDSGISKVVVGYDLDDFYKFSYRFNKDYQYASTALRRNRTYNRRTQYSLTGGYNKFSLYSR